MNTPLVRWLLDVDSIPAGAEGVRIAWEHPLPGWLWLLIALAGTPCPERKPFTASTR